MGYYQNQPLPQFANQNGYQGNIVQNNRTVIPPNQQHQQAPPLGNMPRPSPQPIRTVYSQKTTSNKSFLDMHHYLKAIGIKNNEFMLTLIDPDLDGINPHDPNLNAYYKQKVLREVLCNYWYFLREVVRIPTAGGISARYELHRGNLALNFCLALNLNSFVDLPRQCYKTVSVIARLLYIYNFGTTNSKMAFLHKGADGAKDNLQTLKNLRDLLPPYLQFKERIDSNGKINRGKDNMTEIVSPFNGNSIKTYASATNKAKAASLLRGKSLAIIYMDEMGFIPFNDTIYSNMIPAFKTTAGFAKANGAPYGIIMTTTPGFMNSDCGRVAFDFKENATPFSETWYDKTYAELMAILDANTKSSFVYIKFTYQELGKSEAWFADIAKEYYGKYGDLAREILLKWDTGVENSPFDKEDLEALEGMICQKPIHEDYIFGKYLFTTYLQADTRTYPPLIGVDVAAGYKQDSSTITVVDSRTTKVLGCMNCNYISQNDLARVIEFIVKNWMPNAIVNVERNGGYGSAVIAKLLQLGLRKNLYYEIKDKPIEERQDGVHAYRQKIRIREYGLNSNKAIRNKLIDILIDRVKMHKDKIVSPIIYNEILGMEVKRNGKVEHSLSTHDDQIFSMLMALYMWYEGTDMGERFGMKKTTIKTDEDADEVVDYFDPDTTEIIESFNVEGDELQEEIQRDLDAAVKAGGIPMDKFLEQRRQQEKIQLETLLHTPLGQRAYRQTYNIPDDTPISNYIGDTTEFRVPDHVFYGFYNPTDRTFSESMDRLPANQMTAPAEQAELLEDDEYSYRDHFNFY